MISSFSIWQSGQKRIPKRPWLVKGKMSPKTYGPQGWHFFDRPIAMANCSSGPLRRPLGAEFDRSTTMWQEFRSFGSGEFEGGRFEAFARFFLVLMCFPLVEKPKRPFFKCFFPFSIRPSCQDVGHFILCMRPDLFLDSTEAFKELRIR